MGLFSGFGARRQENQELQALVQVSQSIMARITAAPKGHVGPHTLFVLEPPELAAISAGLMSKGSHPRNRALQLIENVQNIDQIEGQIVQALFLSDDNQKKTTCLERDIPRLDPIKAVAVFSRIAHDQNEAEKVRSIAARQLTKFAQSHPEGVNILADLIAEKTPPTVITPILQQLLEMKLDPIIVDKIMKLRGHPQLHTVAEAILFLTHHSETKRGPNELSHVARLVESKQGDLFRAQIHAGLMSQNIGERCAACVLIAKDPRVAENTLERLVEIQKDLFSDHRQFSLQAFSVKTNLVAKILFPPESMKWRRFVPDIEPRLSIHRVWTHALGYAAAHQSYDSKVVKLLGLCSERTAPHATRNKSLRNSRAEINSNVFTVWRDLHLACKDSDSLLASLLKKHFEPASDSSLISQAFQTAHEISEWTGPMALDCAPALVNCLQSSNADVRAYITALIAGLGSKIKDGTNLVAALPKAGLEIERMFEPLIHASFAPESPATILLLRKALMDSSSRVARAGVIASERIGIQAAQLKGELTLLAFSEDEVISLLARAVLADLGVQLNDKESGPDGFFSLRMAG